MDFDTAEASCERDLVLPGNLITVTDKAVSDWIISKSVQTWIGLQDKVGKMSSKFVNCRLARLLDGPNRPTFRGKYLELTLS